MASELLVPEPCTGPEGSSGVGCCRMANAGDSPRHVGTDEKKEVKDEQLLFPIYSIAVYLVVHRGSEPKH